MPAKYPAVFGAQNRAVGARGPRHAPAHVVDAAQVGGGAGVQDRPLRVRGGDENEQKEKQAVVPEHSEQCRRRQLLVVSG